MTKINNSLKKIVVTLLFFIVAYFLLTNILYYQDYPNSSNYESKDVKIYPRTAASTYYCFNQTDIEEAIVTGYYLHNLYNAFESIFKLVAEVFENNIPDTSRWHTLLLDRMGRDIEETRPPLLSDTALAALDELRRFRHLFRHLYRYDLEPEGVQRALAQAHRLQSVYRQDINQFFIFLDSLKD